MFELPLIRFDNKQWAEKLQAGEFFMRSSFYYQWKESDDLARSDPYDGSVPFPNCTFAQIGGHTVKNPRLMEPHMFIKCFFHCTLDNIIRVGTNRFRFLLSGETKEEIMKFNVDSALVITSPSKMLENIVSVFHNRGENVYYGNVEYCKKSDCEGKVNRILNDLDNRKILSFYKDDSYSLQQEFRVCVRHPFENIQSADQYLDIPSSIVEQSYSEKIERIDDSFIISTQNLLNNGFLIDIDNDVHYYFCEE